MDACAIHRCAVSPPPRLVCVCVEATLCALPLVSAVRVCRACDRKCADWKNMKTIGLRQCMRKASVMGGQGFGLCKCTGPCKKNSRCSCRKANRLCTRRCHTKPYKHNCTNCEEFNDDEEEAVVDAGLKRRRS